jgi:flavin reductase (DIM6/NTAB) family NADH-FMN oxidoreductase RutF
MNSIVDTKGFRNALGKFPTGVCIVTCHIDGSHQGMTISSFNSLSLDPALVLFSVDKRAFSLSLWERAQGYAIHVLTEEQQSLSNRFASRGANKWEGVPVEKGLFDAPLLTGVAARFECARHNIHEAGDHRLFIAKVERFTAYPERTPLLFAGGRYGQIKTQTNEMPTWPLDIHY